MVVIVMGVSGVGKTTIGKLLAEKLGYEFAEGDDFHPPANVEKMRSGVPLDDADRGPWLDALRAHIESWQRDGRNVVLASSALKRAYRDQLTHDLSDVPIVHLHASPQVIGERLRARRGHFMPPGLLESQLETLEPPSSEESALTVDAGVTPDEVVDSILQRLHG